MSEPDRSFKKHSDYWTCCNVSYLCVCRSGIKVKSVYWEKNTAWWSVFKYKQALTFSDSKWFLRYSLVVSESNTVSSRLEITGNQSLSSGQGTADISTDWASESASIQAELSTVYLSKMGAADFFVRRDRRYVTLSLRSGLKLCFISVWRLS